MTTNQPARNQPIRKFPADHSSFGRQLGRFRPGYVLLLILCLAGFVIALFPAASAWRYLEPRLAIPASLEMHVNQVEGSIWRGAAVLYSPRRISANLVWQLNGVSLTRPGLSYDVSLAAPGMQLQATVTLAVDAIELTGVNGQLQGITLQQLAYPRDIAMEGVLNIENAHTLLQNGWPMALAGGIHWSGGLFSINANNPGGLQFSQSFSPVQGQFDLEDDSPALRLMANGTRLADFMVSQDGWLSMNIYTLPGLPASQEDRKIAYEEKLW